MHATTTRAAFASISRSQQAASPVMAARLKRHIGRSSSASSPAITQRVNFGMAFAALQMRADPDDAAILHDDTADDRIDIGLTGSPSASHI